MRNLEEALAEVDHVRNNFKHEGYQKAFEKIMQFLNDLREFLSDEKYVSTEIGLKRKKEHAIVLKMESLTKHQKNVLWLSQDKNRNFILVKRAYLLLTTAPNGRSFLPYRANLIVSSFIYIYDYIFYAGTVSSRRPFLSDWVHLKTEKDAADSLRIIVRKQEFNAEDHKNLVKTNRKSRWKGDLIMDDPAFYHELQIHCMSPAVAFQDFQKAHSILLASGTMSPLDTFESELGVPFQHKVEADHVVKSDQVFCRYITKAKNGYQLNSTFRNRDNPNYLEGLGELVVDVAQKIKSGGILVFFSSYSEMNSKLSAWTNMKIYDKLSNLATIFDEKSIRKVFILFEPIRG